jgi:putative transposase
MQVFFSEDDYRSYLRILAEEARRHEVEVWAYCLMPNHVHLIAVPPSAPSLAKALGEAHRRYAWRVNRRQGWAGHLWQERFSSFAMDEPHLSAAIRYVLLNPVRAGLAQTAAEWTHSSARAHLASAPDELVDPRPAALRIKDWDRFLRLDEPREEIEELRRHCRVGRPLGSDAFLDALEQASDRPVRPRRAGRKPRAQ